MTTDSTPAARAVELFARGFNCSQAVFVAFAPSLGLTEETALRISSGFGGGVGRMGGLCGAASGAIMALGLAEGNVDPADKAAKDRGYELVRTFAGRFRDRNGSLSCRDLLGLDLSTEEGRALAGRNTHANVCPKFVRDAAELLAALLEEVRP